MNEKWGDGKIFINNELLSFNKELFYKVRVFAKIMSLHLYGSMI